MVGVLQEAGEDLHHPRVELSLVGRQRVPVLHVRVVAREFGVLGDQAQLLLTGECSLPVGVPAVVEGALVLISPLLGDVVRGMLRPGREVQEERLVRRHLLAVGDERDRLVDQILGQVVALLGRLLRLDPMVVVRQFRVVLVRVAAEEAVIALEAPAERPPRVRAGGGDLVCRGQVPLADSVGVVALTAEDLRQEAVLERDVAVVSGKAGRHFGDRGHVVRMVVATGEHARPARGAECGRVHVLVAQAVGREGIDVRRPDGTAVAAELPVPRVVDDDEQDVRGTFPGALRFGPCLRRLIECPTDDPWKRGPGPVFLERHGGLPFPLSAGVAAARSMLVRTGRSWFTPTA